ncbi:MAG TPA: glycosyltransferase family 39 protein [Dehalococcoidia bacterium]|nr:glycosyltransferase family 39 protein [Dehalococcoidia bacterium]
MTPRHLTIDRATAAFAVTCVLLVAVAFLMRVPSLAEPRWYRDEGIFAAVAYDIRHGQTLYSGAWDNKPPLIFYTYAGIQAVFGNGVVALHLVTSIVVLLTLMAVMAIALRLYGRWRALLAGVLFAAMMCTPVIEGNLAMTETYMILPATLAVGCVLFAGAGERRLTWYAAAGALLGVAALYKQVAVFDGAAIAVYVWLVEPRHAGATKSRALSRLVMLAAAFAAPQIAFAAYFLVTGAFPAYWYAIAGSLPLYSSLGPEENALMRFAAYVPALLVTAWLARRRAEGGSIGPAQFPALWLSFAVAGATSSNLPFPHYLQQAAPALALTAASIPALAPRDKLERVTLAAAAALALVLVAGQFGEARDRRQLSPLAYYENYVSYRAGERDYQQYERFFDGSGESVRDIAREIERDGAGTTVYSWSELPWLYAAGGVSNPARYYTSFLGELVPDAKATIIRELEASPPAYIVVSDNAYAPFGDLDDLIADRYVLLVGRNDWRLYRLSSLHGAGPPPDTGPGDSAAGG